VPERDRTPEALSKSFTLKRRNGPSANKSSGNMKRQHYIENIRQKSQAHQQYIISMYGDPNNNKE